MALPLPATRRRIDLALVALALTLIWLLADGAPARAQEQPPDPQTYAAWVREALAAARRGDRIGLEESGARLIAVTQIQGPDGATLAADNRWLREELARPTPDLTMIAERLGAIADALAQPPGAAPADALDRLDALLRAPPYGTRDPAAASPPPAWLLAFLEWLVRLIEAMLTPFGGMAGGTGTTVAWVIASVGIVALLIVVVLIARGLRRARVVEDAPEGDPEANLTARAAIDQASSIARAGDYRTAVRFLYLAALLRLDERGLLRYDRALTNREHLDRLRDNPPLQAALARVVDTFDNVWYGSRAIDQAAFEQYRASVERIGRDV
jgi:Domain of unknown function (DUF4129)